MHGQNIMRGVLEEKTTRVAEVVISSVKPETLLAGKVLGVGARGTDAADRVVRDRRLPRGLLHADRDRRRRARGAAAAARGAASPAASAASTDAVGVIGIALAYFLVGFVFYATLFAAAGSMVNSEQEAQQAAMPVMHPADERAGSS